jgi:hypothetical protein
VAGQRLAAAVNGAASSLTREREEGKIKEEEDRAARRFKRLSHATSFGTTNTHASHDRWPVSHTTAVGATESRQSSWHDSDHMMPRRHQATRLPHESH